LFWSASVQSHGILRLPFWGEFENFKRRILREQDQAIRFANEKLLIELISILDLFDLALKSAENLKAKSDPEVNTFITGVEMTQRELLLFLQRFGVEFLPTEGVKFEPTLHEAIGEKEGDEENVGKVLQTVQRGCKLQGRLLKPARVIVGKAKE
jgi:molecular chaperone GrpE